MVHEGPSRGVPSQGDRRAASPGPSRPVVVTAWVMAAWCVGFAAVNVGQLVTGGVADGPFADYATGLSVMVWVVLVLKLAGAAVALLSVAADPAPVPPRAVAVLVWGAAALLTLYSAGSVVEAIGMVTGVAGDVDEITPLSVGYVAFFLLGAAGYGALAGSFSRRHGVDRRAVVLGVLGAPVLLGLVLLAIPALLAAAGVMPGS